MLSEGIHYDVSFEDYCREPGMNASTLKWAQASGEHLKAALDGKMKKDSPAMNLGRAVHARLLEPDFYREQFKVATGCQAELKSGARKGKECGNGATFLVDDKWLCGTHAKGLGAEPEKNVLSSFESNVVESIADKVKNHKVVNLLRQRGGYEATMIWEMEDTRCKGRADKLVPRTANLPPVIIDLKKVRLGYAARDRFEKQIAEYGYDIQAAWYVDGAAKLLDDEPLFVWIAIEEEYPFGLNVIQADKETILIGRLRYCELLGTYLRCKSIDRWDGYTDSIVTGGLPSWMKARYLGRT